MILSSFLNSRVESGCAAGFQHPGQCAGAPVGREQPAEARTYVICTASSTSHRIGT